MGSIEDRRQNKSFNGQFALFGRNSASDENISGLHKKGICPRSEKLLDTPFFTDTIKRFYRQMDRHTDKHVRRFFIKYVTKKECFRAELQHCSFIVFRDKIP